MIQLWRDPETDKWGLKQFRLADGSYDHCVPVDDAVKPEALEDHDHGTMVVLLGHGAEDNTIEGPAGVENRAKWITKYLNQRYFRFPENVASASARAGTRRAQTRSATSCVGSTAKSASSSARALPMGASHSPGARAHWWILDERHDERSRESTWASTGHRAALYHDELYELVTPARGGYQKVQEFGVRFAYSARRHLRRARRRRGGRSLDFAERAQNRRPPLPWAGWAEEFQVKLPPEIRALEEEIAAGSAVEDHRRSIRDRLRPLRDLFRVSQYRPAPAGPGRRSGSEGSRPPAGAAATGEGEGRW